MTTRLLLIRHGEPVDDARGRCYGTLDVALSPRGAEQANVLARELGPIELAAVYTSPRQRSRETALAVCRGRSLELLADERLRELDFGLLEGRAYEEIERTEPEFFRRWMETPALVRFPGGEGYDDLRARVRSALDDIRARHRDGTVAIVAHGGVVRAALAEALDLADERLFALDVGYGRLAAIDWFEGDAVVRLVNGRGSELPPARLAAG